MRQYVLNGASQTGVQWDGSKYVINPGEIVIKLTKRILCKNLYMVKSDGRIITINDSIIKRYFTEVDRGDKMKVVVDKLPETYHECLFKSGWGTCQFATTTGCPVYLHDIDPDEKRVCRFLMEDNKDDQERPDRIFKSCISRLCHKLRTSF